MKIITELLDNLFLKWAKKDFERCFIFPDVDSGKDIEFIGFVKEGSELITKLREIGCGEFIKP